MQELLPESWQTAGQEGENLPQKCSKRRVLDIKVWVQCFACYMGVLATRNPQRIPELLAYLIQIVRVNQEFEGSGWAVYDETFCRHAAVSGNQQWSKLNTSLFLLCFTGKGCRTGRCSWCLNTTHTTETCQVTQEEGGLSQEEQNLTGRHRRGGSHPQCSPRQTLAHT